MSKSYIEDQLNDEQKKAVTTIKGPCLIIAGAGSGKTRVITYRIAYMLEKGIPQSSILALTFTNKAAREMETRIKKNTGKKLQSLTISTFHAFGLSIIRDNAEVLGYRKNFSVYDETDKTALIKESIRECKIPLKNIDLYALSQHFSKIKTGMADWTKDASMPPFSRRASGNDLTVAFGDSRLQDVYNEYQSALKIYNAVDFDDLLTVPLELFENNIDILNKYRKKYKYIMVDEFQDTSLIQYKLLRYLAPEKSSNVCVVGDDDQSIYSWRGANFENILLFERDFPERIEIKLEQNYRSTSTILEAANGVISHNKGRKDKKLWSGNEGGKPVELFYPENENAEADFIANQIRNISLSESLNYHDFGVLTRTNSLMRNIEESFLAENIPYKVSGGTSFFQRKEIKDIISYLRIIANPDDDVSLLRIINTPRRGIGKTTIVKLNEIAKKNHISLWTALDRLNYARSQGQQSLFHDKITVTELEDFTNMIENFKTLFIERKTDNKKKWSLADCVKILVDNIDYWSYLVVEHSKDEKKARWKFNNIEYFTRMIEFWENDPDNLDISLYSWLNRISLITKDDGNDDNKGKVNLMTIHAAKGLEFPVVFIAGAEKGLIPHDKSIGEGENEAGSIEEERRLFYVAITRAKEKLFITSCKQRSRMNNTSICQPSPFLEEIPKELIAYHVPAKDTIPDKEQAEDFFAQMRAKMK